MTGLARRLGAMALPAGLALHAVAGAPEAPASPVAPCTDLAGLAVPASAIGLATRGATVATARLVPDAEDDTLGEYCLVDGAVASLSASAQPIRFQAALPTRWNRKLLQLGDGGFRGSVTSPTANRGGTSMTPAPLARGYVVFGSDAGHSGNPLDASFALDPEQLRNYAGEQIKKTADTIRVVIRRYYDLPAGHSYYLGASNGGREAITAIRDYPEDYEGAVSIMPGLGFTRMALKMQLIQRAMRLDDGAGRIDGAGAEFLRRRVLEQCDSLDGLEDGIVSRPESCDVDFGRLRCPGGADTGPDCFSNAQVATLELMHSPTPLDYAFPGGLDSLPGFPHGLGRSSRVPLLAALEDWVEDGAAPADLVALDANVAPRERSRPVCRYPTWPAYDGTGDPDSAASFRCVEGAP